MGYGWRYPLLQEAEAAATHGDVDLGLPAQLAEAVGVRARNVGRGTARIDKHERPRPVRERAAPYVRPVRRRAATATRQARAAARQLARRRVVGELLRGGGARALAEGRLRAEAAARDAEVGTHGRAQGAVGGCTRGGQGQGEHAATAAINNKGGPSAQPRE